jgi:hypothetical protein
MTQTAAELAATITRQNAWLYAKGFCDADGSISQAQADRFEDWQKAREL